MLKHALAIFALLSSPSVLLTWNQSTDVGTVNVYRATGTGATFAKIASGVPASGPYVDSAVDGGQEYRYQLTAVVDSVESVPTPPVDVALGQEQCPATATFDPTKPGQLTICDPTSPSTTACILSQPGSTTLCRINGTINISENGNPFRVLFNAPVDVFKFVAPTNIVVSPTTSYYLGSLVALGHNPDMVYLVPNNCNLTKIVYDARMSGALTTPITISMWDLEDKSQVPDSAVTQTWTGVTVESVATMNWPILGGDHLQVRFTMPAGVPAGFYINMTVTAYCVDR